MDGRPTWTDCDEAGDYVVPNVLSPRDLVFRPDNIDETTTHQIVILTYFRFGNVYKIFNLANFSQTRNIVNSKFSLILKMSIFRKLF